MAQETSIASTKTHYVCGVTGLNVCSGNGRGKGVRTALVTKKKPEPDSECPGYLTARVVQ